MIQLKRYIIIIIGDENVTTGTIWKRRNKKTLLKRKLGEAGFRATYQQYKKF